MKLKLLFFAVCVPAICQAQLHVKGIVNIESGSPLPFASVLLLNSSDSSLVRGEVSADDGSFQIDVNSRGNYFVSISAIGYRDVSTNVFNLDESSSPVDHGPIVVIEKMEELSEVIVEATRPMFEQKIDRTVINVQSNISRAGGSALDVLQRSPGVTVDKMNDAIALSGKQGVRIMINGKMSRIPMSAVVQMLDGMNAENIDRIELITTPPSKYEAEGDAGMINIVMKKTEDIGTNGSVSFFSGYGRDVKYGGTLNLNNRTKKLNVYGDLTTRHDHSQQFLNTDWSVLIDDARNATTSNNDRKPYTGINTGTIGFDWTAGKKTTISGLFSVFDRRWDMDALANISQTVGQSSSSGTMKTIEENDWLQLLGNLNVRHDFSKDYGISIDFDRIDYNSQNPTDYFQNFFDSQDNETTEGQLRSRKDTGIDIWTAAVDFTGKINEKVTVEIGAKESLSLLDNDIVVEELETGTWTADNALTSYAEMFENIAAGYASAKIRASAKMEFQLGLRYEHTLTNIDTRGQNDVVDRSYGKWFPSIFVQRKINEKNSWVMSYSRRISRPSFFQLAPFVIFNDPNNFYSGNIALLPSLTDVFKMEYRLKAIMLSLQYSRDKNAITLFQPRINEDNKQVSTAENLDYRRNISLVLSFPLQITKWWESQFNVAGIQSSIRAIYLDNPISLSIMNFNFNASQKFNISKTVTAELSGFYQSRQFFGVLQAKPFGSLDIGIEKKFANSSLRVSYGDILSTNKWDWSADIPAENLDTNVYIDFETTVVNVTWLVNFGNDKLRGKKSRRTASKEEQDRLR